MTSNRETESQQENPMYRIHFDGCLHTVDADLSIPDRRS
jgi:hypothetical protein